MRVRERERERERDKKSERQKERERERRKERKSEKERYEGKTSCCDLFFFFYFVPFTESLLFSHRNNVQPLTTLRLLKKKIWRKILFIGSTS